ncbi:ESX secretion-associated protein EspG [Nocardia sp. alder85J]|uniref:ESX secretion-associated protein EspG n=1 Tax=Nocardia sp. alder85J TaxID=2862949 RepID=UPI001CD31283|nr:ESX secretion-associated protein EspG [Nocardia sp. alder85J]MCX4092030.1 ESX secretion-associated protein EspG [Nocardia sp. alder85J]
MASEWDWEPDDFAVLWHSDAHDRFPRPLAYTSRFRTVGGVAAHRDAVHTRYDRDEIERIRLAFHTLDAADLRIEIRGDSSSLGNGTPREYRVLGARTAQHAVLLTQTATVGVDGHIRCRIFRPDDLAPRLAHILPRHPAGAEPPETFHRTDLTTAAAPDDHRPDPRRRLHRRTHRADGGGVAALTTGALYADPAPRYTTQWLDIPGDGRYLQQLSADHLTLRPVAVTDLTALFAGWIDHTLQRRRDNESW